MSLGGVAVGAREIHEADLSVIKTIPNHKNIAIVAPKLLGAIKVRRAQAPQAAARAGRAHGRAPGDEFTLKQWWSLDGRPPASGDEVVAGAAAARALRAPPGDRVELAGKPLHRLRRAAAHRLPGRQPAHHRLAAAQQLLARRAR